MLLKKCRPCPKERPLGASTLARSLPNHHHKVQNSQEFLWTDPNIDHLLRREALDLVVEVVFREVEGAAEVGEGDLGQEEDVGVETHKDEDEGEGIKRKAANRDKKCPKKKITPIPLIIKKNRHGLKAGSQASRSHTTQLRAWRT